MAPVAERLRAVHAQLASVDGPPPGRAWCRSWTAELDAAIAELHAELELPAGRFAVAAVGGYGRREVCPSSDVDVLIVTDGLESGAESLLVRSVIYPLWDAGLKVGYAVRDLRGAVDVAANDATVATSTLEMRPVAGEISFLRAAEQGLIDDLTRRPQRFLETLADANRKRRARYGDAAEVLEPDLKSGAGGQRDMQSLRWAAAALLREPSLDALVASRYLSAADRARLAHANDLFLAIRVALHLETGRGVDRLTLERQDAVASRMVDAGLLQVPDGQQSGEPADRLMRAVFLASRTVDQVYSVGWRLMLTDAGRLGTRRERLRRVRRPIEAELASGAVVSDGILRLPDADLPAGLPAQLLRDLTATGANLDRVDADRISRAARSDPGGFEAGQALREAIVAAASNGHASFAALAEVDDVGLLGAVLPGWSATRGRAQRNPLHRYSLDRHLLHAVATLGDVIAGEPWAATAAERVDDIPALVVALLVHDIGKPVGEPHARTGVPIALAICEALGLSPASTGLVARLVRHHLLLPDIATRRDLADTGLLENVAASIGDVQTLDCLHLLAAADGLATGPAAWSPWRAALVSDLVMRLRPLLSASTQVGEGGARRVIEEGGELAAGIGLAVNHLAEHVELAGARYLATVDLEDVVRHAAMCAAPLEEGEVRTHVAPGDLAGTDVLHVVAVDRPGLFAAVAGVLAIHGVTVLAANATTRSDGVAVDTFTVGRSERSGPHGAADAAGGRADRWAEVTATVAEAVAGRLAVRARVARRAEASRNTGYVPEVATKVEVSPDVSGETSLIEVHTADGVGVLHRIVDAMAELTLDVVSARVDTLGHEVTDVFYVRDAAGQPLDEEHATEVVLAISSALEG